MPPDPETSRSTSISPAPRAGMTSHPLYPWLVWSGGAALFFYSFFQRVTPSVMVDDLMRDFAVGGAILGTLSAFYFYPYAALQIPLGLMLDRWGPRRLLTGAAALCAVGTVLFATADTLPAAYIGRALIGAGCAFGWIGSLTLVALWFPPERFAGVMGATSLIGMTGAVGGQAPLAAVVEAFGWRETLLAASVYGAVLAVFLWAVVRERPASAGPLSSATQPTPRTSVGRDVAELVRTPQIWAAGLVIATVGVPLMVFASLWGVPYMIAAHGLSRPAAAAGTSMILIGWGMGAASLGWLSDHLHRRRAPLLGGAILSFAAILVVIYVPGLPIWAVFVLLFANGFFGGSSPIGFAVCRENCRAAVSSTSMGIANAVTMAMSAVFQPVVGWLLDLAWEGRMVDGARVYSVHSYKVAFLSLAACAVVAVVAAYAIRETHCRRMVPA